MMVQGDRSLHHPLPDFLFRVWRYTPDVFEHLMRVKEFALIKEGNSVLVFGFLCGHGYKCRKKPDLAPYGREALDVPYWPKIP